RVRVVQPGHARARPQGLRRARLAPGGRDAVRHVPAHAAHRMRHAAGARAGELTPAGTGGRSGVLRCPVMLRPLRIAWRLRPVVALSPPSARAFAVAPTDSSLLIVYEHDQPVANERNYFTDMGDSIVIQAETQRQFLDDKGARHPFLKTMMLVVDSHDLGLIRYQSTQDFDGHQIPRGV